MTSRNPAHWLGSLGGALALLAPKGLCPLCVAASGGVLSSVGLGFIAEDSTIRWLLPITLAIGVLGLALAARSHRRFWSLGVGACGALVLYAGWYFDVGAALYGGMALLLFASVLNMLLRRPRQPLVQLRIRKETGHGTKDSGDLLGRM